MEIDNESSKVDQQPPYGPREHTGIQPRPAPRDWKLRIIVSYMSLHQSIAVWLLPLNPFFNLKPRRGEALWERREVDADEGWDPSQGLMV